MGLELEIKEAVSALRSAAKECGDVVAAAARPDELPDDFEGRGYAFMVQRISDAHLIVNNVLRDIGETPAIPAAPAPREVERVVTEEVLIEAEKVVTDETAQDTIDQLRAQIAKKDGLLDMATQEIEQVMAENQKLKAEAANVSEKVLAELEGVEEKLAEREPLLSFGKDFIEQELADGENIPAANQRLLEEFEELQQAKASLTPEQDERREHLRSAFYGFRG
jgi:hypothetical protein